MAIKKENLKRIISAAEATLNHIRCSATGLVDTKSLVEAVEDDTGIKIHVLEAPFSRIRSDEPDLSDFGAMMRIEKSGNNEEATIILNSNKDAIFKRFSLAHELGHLRLGFDYHDLNDYVVSSHIQYYINWCDKTLYKNDSILEKEISANIFALSVLIPNKHLKIQENICSIPEMAKNFAVTKEAVISKLYLNSLIS